MKLVGFSELDACCVCEGFLEVPPDDLVEILMGVLVMFLVGVSSAIVR